MNCRGFTLAGAVPASSTCMRSDFVLACRNLIRNPRFSLLAVLSIALGIAATSAIFSFVHAILLAPLPFRDSDRLVSIQETVRGREAGGSPVRVFDWLQAPSIASVTAMYGESFTLQNGDIPERVRGAFTLGEMLETLNVRPALGRAFTAQESRGHGGPVAVIGDSLWRRNFRSDPAIVGRNIRLNAESYQVIGVLPPEAALYEYEILTPVLDPKMPRAARFLGQIARLRPDATLAQAQTELELVAGRLRQQYPETDADLGVRAAPLRDVVAGSARLPLLILQGAVAFVLLMSCLNVANLTLARIAGRSQELAVRQALGAGRARLVRLLLSESMLIAAAGGLLSIVGTLWAIDLLRTFAPDSLPRLREVRLDATVVVFAGALTLIAGLIAGLLPALRFSSVDVNDTLRNGARGNTRRGGLQTILVVAQIALSLALMVGGGLLFRTLWNLDNRPLGFAAERLLTFRLSLPWQTPQRVHALYSTVLDRMSSVPGVSAAALTDRLPFDGGTVSSEVYIPGRTAFDLMPGSQINQRMVSPNYFQVLRVPLQSGRYLDNSDRTARRAVINQSAARVYFGAANPIGQRMGLIWNSKPPGPDGLYEIIGVVSDLPFAVRDKTAPPAMYIAFTQSFWPLAHFVLRTRSDPGAMTETLRRELAAVDSTQAIELVQTMDDYLSARDQTTRLQAWLVAIFASAALLLAAVGIYGVVAASVADRRTEIGIRMALGEQPESVLYSFLGSTLRLGVIGSVVGIAIAALLTRGITKALYGVSAADPVTYLLTTAVLIAVVLLAAWWPARSAARMDRMAVLRRPD